MNNPKYKIGDKVFVYHEARLVVKTVKSVRHTDISLIAWSNEYLFEEDLYPLYERWKYEFEVFATKDEFIEAISK